MNKAVINVITRRALPALTQRAGRQKLVLRKQSPHIFFAAGVVGSVASTVLACRATLSLPATLEEIETDLGYLREIKQEPRVIDEGSTTHYTEKELHRDAFYIYVKAAGKLGRLYGPSVTVGVLSLAALTGSHVTMARRNTSLMAAYAAVAKAYDDYRGRVATELGAEKERDLYHAKVSANTNEQGDEVAVVDSNRWSPYAKFFDETSPNWEKHAEFNRLFLVCQQNYANDILQARGHLFLNEVYDMLGIERTQAGAVVGWVISKKGDNFVDFGMYEAVSAQFINGWEPRVILDFNVDGVIYDKI